MTNDKTLTYSVIITITLPGQSGETALRLTLGPADRVPTPDGTVRLLQDCTLAELQQFADALEADIWRDYLDATLVDLVVDESLQIDFVFDDIEPEGAPPDNLLLDHVVIFPEDQAETVEAPPSLPQPDLVQQQIEADEADRPAPLSEEDIAVSDAAPQEDGDSEPTSAQVEDAIVDDELPPVEPVMDQPQTAEEEPLVTVAEPEPVHEEREAPPEPEVPVVRPRVRILGRRRPLGHGTPSAVDILINEPAFRDAQAHAISSPEREVAGVLVGPPPEKQPDGRYVVHVSDTIIAKHTRMQGASVTYTPESWRYVNDRLAAMYPDDTAVIVGWYHTHPGFGIFLSGMDRFIHHNFFTQLWHVALVLDPLARRSGFFSWNRARTQVDAYDFPWPNWAADSW